MEGKCIKCKYFAEQDGQPYCRKIAEKLLGLKGCGEFQERSPFDPDPCPVCGKPIEQHPQHVYRHPADGKVVK